MVSTRAQEIDRVDTPETVMDRRVVPVGAIVLTTFFALLYALRSSISLIDRGEDPRWAQQVVWSLAMWWTCLPFLPPLAWLVRRFPVGRPHLFRNAGILLLGIVTAAWFRHVVMTPIVGAISSLPNVAVSAAARTLTYFTVFLVMVALLHAAHYYRAERARAVREAALARGFAEARLAALRTQLQPHFVFNVLNAVTTLVHTDPMSADRMLTRFAELLRVILHEETEEHSLDRELDLLARYVELMQLRFDDRILVQWDVDDAVRSARVPFLVLQPLVENAYEHGLSGRETGGRVRIGTSRAGDNLQLIVEDDGTGFEAQSSSVSDRGIGLRNTRDRLAQLYGARASLVLERPQGGGTRAVVTLPFIDDAQQGRRART